MPIWIDVSGCRPKALLLPGEVGFSFAEWIPSKSQADGSYLLNPMKEARHLGEHRSCGCMGSLFKEA
jgi:hypothetical protein